MQLIVVDLVISVLILLILRMLDLHVSVYIFRCFKFIEMMSLP